MWLFSTGRRRRLDATRPLEFSRVRSIRILLCDKIALMSPIPIERITPQNIGVFKDVRLRALQEAPYAFGSTYAREVQFDDAEWARRVERWNGERGVGFVAMHGAAACGIAGSLLDDKDPTHAQLVSMWTAPTHRQLGIGRLLVDAVLDWARSRNLQALLLMVTSNNRSAIRFYEHLGFTKTGRTEPYPNDANIFEYEMSQPLRSATPD